MSNERNTEKPRRRFSAAVYLKNVEFGEMLCILRLCNGLSRLTRGIVRYVRQINLLMSEIVGADAQRESIDSLRKRERHVVLPCILDVVSRASPACEAYEVTSDDKLRDCGFERPSSLHGGICVGDCVRH